MSECGTYAVRRDIWGNPAFAHEPYTEAQAYVWLVGQAAYTAHDRRVGSEIVHLERGQTCHSIRFLADLWQWSKSRVDRYIGRLEKRDMVKRDTGTEPTVITICDYNEVQPQIADKRDSKRDTGRDTKGTPAGQERDKLEEGNNLDPSLRSGLSERERKHPWPENYQDLFWQAYPRRTARKKAFEALERLWKADATPFDVIVAGCIRLEKWMQDPRYVPHPATWLNGERWNDDLPQRPSTPPSRPPPGQRVSGLTALAHDKAAARQMERNREPTLDLEPLPFPTAQRGDPAHAGGGASEARRDELWPDRDGSGTVHDFSARRAFGG
jgi:hypothetical protein